MAEARRNPLEAGIARLYHYEKFKPEWLGDDPRRAEDSLL